MGFFDWINEQIYIMFSMYYYEVFEYKDSVQVGRFIQLLSYHPDFVVDFKKKIAWPIIKGVGFNKGHKIILHYQIDHALPLVETIAQEIKELNPALVKVQTVTKLSGKYTKEDMEKSKGMALVNSYNFPPHMIFEMFNGTFVTKTLSKGKTTDWTMIAVAICVVIFLIAFMAIMVFGLAKPIGG